MERGARLAVLAARSGIGLLEAFRDGWEVAVAEYSRFHGGGVRWWTPPRRWEYGEIVIADRNVMTGLTQLRIRRELSRLGISGPAAFAGTASGTIGHAHLDFVIRDGRRFPNGGPCAGLHDRYLIALVGLPASGKSMLRSIFSCLPGFSAYKWGRYFVAEAKERYGPICGADLWEIVKAFTLEAEPLDAVAVARRFAGDPQVRRERARFLVADGIKTREQIAYCSYALGRPAIVVRVHRDEAERLESARSRGDFDDFRDAERLELLRRMGALEAMDMADFCVRTTGCRVDYGARRALLAPEFVADMSEVLCWLGACDGREAAWEAIRGAMAAAARERGAELEAVAWSPGG